MSEVCYEFNIVGLNIVLRKPLYGTAQVELETPGKKVTLNEVAFSAWMEAFREVEKLLSQP